MRHATELSRELERAWSEALDTAAIDQARQELNTRVSALVTGLTAAIQQTEAELTAARIDPKINTHPDDPAAWKALASTADPKQRRSQLVVAQMICLREFLKAFTALQEPSSKELNRTAGRRAEWFEAGAFAMLRDRAALLVRATHEVGAATNGLLGAQVASKLDLSVRAAFESLDAARRAFSRGDVDAALIHCRAALRSSLESLPFVHAGDDRLSAPGALLAEVPSLHEYAPALRLLDHEAAALAYRRADLGIAVPLLDGLLPLVATILSEPPIVELQELVASDSQHQ